MSYLQIEIGGKLRGLKFSQGTNILLQDKISVLDESERKAFGVQFIIWGGLKTNAILKGGILTKSIENPDKGKEKQPDTIEVPATFEDVCEWTEKLPQDVVINIVNLYTETNAFKDDLAAPVEDEKKNQPETTEQTATDLPGS